MNGFKTDLTTKILGLNPHIVIQPNSFVIEDEYILKLKNEFPDIKISKSLSGEGIIIINDNAKGVIFKGIDKNEKIEIIFRKPSFFFGLKFLDEINLSTFVNNFLFF